jgi:cell wall-associated NlpC family hydrolase
VSAQWVAPYVGLPFKVGGRDRSGCDCWGLVWLIYREHAGVTLPSYSETPADDLLQCIREIKAAITTPTWRRIERGALAKLDVAVMFTGRLLTHVGLMVDGERLIHVEEATSAVVVPIGSPFVKNRIAGFYRFQG